MAGKCKVINKIASKKTPLYRIFIYILNISEQNIGSAFLVRTISYS